MTAVDGVVAFRSLLSTVSLLLLVLVLLLVVDCVAF